MQESTEFGGERPAGMKISFLRQPTTIPYYLFLIPYFL